MTTPERDVAALVANIRALHQPFPEGSGGDGPCLADGSAWPCDAEYAARLLSSPDPVAGPADRLAIAGITEERLALFFHREFWDDTMAHAATTEEVGHDYICGDLEARSVERLLAALSAGSATPAPEASREEGGA